MLDDELTRLVKSRVISRVMREGTGSIAVHFTDGSALVVSAPGGLSARVHERGRKQPARRTASQPTARQREYLEFMRRYMARYGVAPAEADIAEHFMVSGPSAHLMLKTLERRGFIVRARGLFGQVAPRSIRILWDE